MWSKRSVSRTTVASFFLPKLLSSHIVVSHLHFFRVQKANSLNGTLKNYDAMLMSIVEREKADEEKNLELHYCVPPVFHILG